MISLRSISASCSIYKSYNPNACLVSSVWRREALPMQQRTFFSWANKFIEVCFRFKNLVHEDSDRGKTTRKLIETITGSKVMNAEESKQASITHQKLWVAHYSIHNHLQCHEHYEAFYSMQLFEEPKKFETQQYYLALVEKKPEELSTKELREIVELYQFSLGQVGEMFKYHPFNHKLEKYQTHLAEREKKTGFSAPTLLQ